LVKEHRQKGSQVIPTTHKILVLVKGDCHMGSQVSPTTQILVLVKGDHYMRSQVSPTTHRILVLVKRDRHMGSQVSPTRHKLWFWLKGIARWDLRLAQPHTRY
jgi:hypothetical protein